MPSTAWSIKWFTASEMASRPTSRSAGGGPGLGQVPRRSRGGVGSGEDQEGRAQQDKAEAERDVAKKEAEAEAARSAASAAEARQKAAE